MTYMVTGMAGFIGFHLAARLAARGDTVIGVDSINDYYSPRLKYDRLKTLGIGEESAEYGKPVRGGEGGNLTFIRLDLADREKLHGLFAARSFDCVVNLAAQAGVRYSLERPYAYLDSNLSGFLNILEECRGAKTPHLVYASSSSVYGLNSGRPFRTGDRTDQPANLYAATKKANELMAHAYAHLYRIRMTGLRFFTVYGPWGRPDMAYFKFAQAIEMGLPIDVYNGGNMYRDFTYIDDIVEGILRVIDVPETADRSWVQNGSIGPSEPAMYRLYNIGNNTPERLGDFIDTLEAALGKKAEKRFLPMQPGDVYATEADISDLERDFGWRPRVRVREGLGKFAAWFAEYAKAGGLS